MSRIDVDVAIVGSGAAGGTVAARMAELAAEGKRVVVFERGPQLQPADFSSNEIDTAERLYRDGGAFMVADGTVSLALGQGYGGSTVMYTGTSLEPPARIIGQWAVPGLQADDLIRRARVYAEQNGVHRMPEELLNDNNRLFRLGCERLGWEAIQFPVNTRGCRGSSLCNLGCPNNAKQGTHVVQLPAAEAAGVDVVTGARVESVADGRLVIDISEPGKHGWSVGRHQVKAGATVLCGGAIGSPAILLRSGLAGQLPALGRYFTCHPAHILVGEHPQPITNTVGHPKSFMWDERIVDDRCFLEACMYFPFVTAKNLTGFGPDHEAFVRAFERLQMILVLACDDALPNQRLTVDGRGRPKVHYRLTRDSIEALVRGTRSAARIFFAAGALSVHAPSARPTRLYRDERDRVDDRIDARHFKPGTVSVSAAHLMGGCRMGVASADSVTDAGGRVHGQPGLFVADASLFPTALEANPYLTIMALADRVADQVIDHVRS